jgi:hypothetical protein
MRIVLSMICFCLAFVPDGVAQSELQRSPESGHMSRWSISDPLQAPMAHAEELQKVDAAERHENLKTCLTGRYPSLCNRSKLTAQELQSVLVAHGAHMRANRGTQHGRPTSVGRNDPPRV